MNLLREILIEKLGGKCVECSCTETLEFDHIDSSTKSFNIASGYTKPKEVLLEEVAKCQLLCNKCHIEKSKKDSKFRPKSCAGGRTLKYSHLGEKVIVRVAQKTTNILPQLQDLMQQLEENGKDSREVISSVLSNIEETLCINTHNPQSLSY
jgi:hypothetical protein